MIIYWRWKGDRLIRMSMPFLESDRSIQIKWSELEKEGLSALGAVEMEFYVFHRYDKSGYEPTWTGLQCYSEVKQAEVDNVLFDLERSQRQWAHFHHSLYWSASGENAFYDPRAPMA